MSETIELNKAIFRAAQEQDQDLGVFSTSDPNIFLQAARLAYCADKRGAALRVDESGNLGAGQMFVFRTFVLQLAEKEKDRVREQLKGIWDSAAQNDIEDLHNILTFVGAKNDVKQFPSKFPTKGLSVSQQVFLLRRIGDMCRTHDAITGYGNSAMKVNVYPNFQRAGEGALTRHTPTHSFAVVNETWFEAGTVMTDEDDYRLTNIPEGDRFFMLPNTRHRPPKRDDLGDRYDNPRLTIFVHEI